ncbi:MAG: hypothetical protein RL213_2263 [Bacteroidota bacterium]
MTAFSEIGPEPVISVIVPSFNQGKYISNTLMSVLAQSYPHWEVIIQDACSTDETETVCRRFAVLDSRIRFFREKDKGFADGVNRGLARANGSICAIQSSDDFYAGPDVFKKVSEAFRSNPGCALVAGDFRMADEAGLELESSPKTTVTSQAPAVRDIYRLAVTFPQGSTFFSTERARQIGGLNGKVDMVADTDFWIRMCACKPSLEGKVLRFQEVWSYAIMHSEQRSTEATRFQIARAAMFRSFLRDEKMEIDPGLRKSVFYAVLVDAFHGYLQKGLPTGDIRELYLDVFQKELPYLWRLKEWLMRYGPIRRLYFRNSQQEETAVYLRGGRMDDVRWFRDMKIPSISGMQIPNDGQ